MSLTVDDEIAKEFIVPQCFVCGGKDESMLDFRHESCAARLAAVEAVVEAARGVDHDVWCGASQHPNAIGGDWCDCSIGELCAALDALRAMEKPS